MRKQTFKPRRLDVEAFARAQASLQGRIGWDALQRLADSVLGPADAAAGGVEWAAEGLWHQPLGGHAEIRVRLRAQVPLRLTCQRCLQPLTQTVGFATTLRFVEGEEAAQALDDASDDEDVLALTRSLDLEELVEDELIMALPIIPRHESCALPAAAKAHTASLDASPDASPEAIEPPSQPAGTRRPLAALGSMLAGSRQGSLTASGRPDEPDEGSSG